MLITFETVLIVLVFTAMACKLHTHADCVLVSGLADDFFETCCCSNSMLFKLGASEFTTKNSSSDA